MKIKGYFEINYNEQTGLFDILAIDKRKLHKKNLETTHGLVFSEKSNMADFCKRLIAILNTY